MLRNQDVRDYAKAKGVRIWELAECYGYTGNNEANFTRRFRTEWTPEEKQKAKAFIDELAIKKGE